MYTPLGETKGEAGVDAPDIQRPPRPAPNLKQDIARLLWHHSFGVAEIHGDKEPLSPKAGRRVQQGEATGESTLGPTRAGPGFALFHQQGEKSQCLGSDFSIRGCLNNSRLEVMVATDVASRGLDIKGHLEANVMEISTRRYFMDILLHPVFLINLLY